MARKTLSLSLVLLALLCVPLALGAFGAPDDDKPVARDDALDDLLKKVGDAEPKPADKGEADTSTDGAAKPSGDVETKDKDLDSLLEKLGTTQDKPSAEERRPGPGGEPPPDKPEPEKKPGETPNKPDGLQGKDKDLEEHLKDVAGIRRKKRKEAEENGPLSQVIKEMDEVKERLGKPDTGEETRKKQAQIVKRIETLIEQARNSQSQSQSKKKSMAMVKGKQQPGQPNNGEQAGTTGGNAPFTKPQKPTDRRSLAGGKELWGDLPPEVRQDLDNVMKEGFLPSREELIRRYYLSLSKKKATRGE